MKPSIKPNGRRRGSALVETGLTLTAFMFMLIGIADFGQFLFVHQALVERARYSARWGALSDPSNVAAIQNMVVYNQTTAIGNGYLGLTASNVNVTNPGAGTDDSRVAISIHDYSYTVLSPYIGGTYTGPNINIVFPVGK